MESLCGRCGQKMDKPVGFLTFHDYSNYPQSANRSDIEMCSTCTEELKKWKAHK
ncbi:hypothetical protein [Nitrososphaera sp.]|uniref:hypothetical protein n=1 Tax=Nitrososphaera sp. TaxID=1971748 RepID=UPI0031725D9B